VEERKNIEEQDYISMLHNRFEQDLTSVNNLILENLECEEKLILETGQYLINSGGKRIRPLLTIMSAKLFGYDGASHLLLAAATEFIHAATLLHDDVVDESQLRRFKPTVNSIWGNKTSILVGDFLFSQSFRLMVKTNSIKSLKCLSDASAIIAMGEVSQLASSNSNKIFSKEKYYKIIEAKTAELFAASAKVGAIISNVPDDICDMLYQYGKHVGLIFQVKDDILDYFSDKETSGKNIGDDFYESKFTLPVILLHEYAEDLDKELILQIFEKDYKKTEVDLVKIIALMNKYKILGKLDDEIYQLKSLAHDYLKSVVDTDKKIHNLMFDLIEFSGERIF
jgi:octaprenyl-diphosphate synthase